MGIEGGPQPVSVKDQMSRLNEDDQKLLKKLAEEIHSIASGEYHPADTMVPLVEHHFGAKDQDLLDSFQSGYERDVTEFKNLLAEKLGIMGIDDKKLEDITAEILGKDTE